MVLLRQFWSRFWSGGSLRECSRGLLSLDGGVCANAQLEEIGELGPRGISQTCEQGRPFHLRIHAQLDRRCQDLLIRGVNQLLLQRLQEPGEFCLVRAGTSLHFRSHVSPSRSKVRRMRLRPESYWVRA